MRLPNNYGSVYKLSGKRRKPWVARKTVGYNEKGQQKYNYIGYYETRAEALEALALHQDIEESPSRTFKEVANEWFAQYHASETTVRNAKYTLTLCERINNYPIEDIKLHDLQNLVDTSGKTHSVLLLWKSMMHNVYKYAIQHEYIPPDKRDLIRYVDLSQAKEGKKTVRSIFTDEEIEALWKENNKHTLILLYTGIRIGELLELRTEDIDLEKQCFHIRKSKTEAGIRTVPIADKIMPFFKLSDSPYFLNRNGKPYTYSLFLKNLWKIENHRPHDTRHTFVSRMVEAGNDERVIETIVGHAQPNVTRSVYMHIGLDVLLEAVNRL